MLNIRWTFIGYYFSRFAFKSIKRVLSMFQLVLYFYHQSQIQKTGRNRILLLMSQFATVSGYSEKSNRLYLYFTLAHKNIPLHLCQYQSKYIFVSVIFNPFLHFYHSRLLSCPMTHFGISEWQGIFLLQFTHKFLTNILEC